MNGLFRFLGGYLRIRIIGSGRERFLNLCAGKEICLWDIAFRNNGFEAWITLRAFYELRPLVRKTKVKVAVTEKCGLPFLLPVLRKRWMFLAGCATAVLFLMISSFFLWEIKCYGNVSVTMDQIEAFLSSQKIRIGMPLEKIDLSGLEKEIRKTFPQIIWTSAKREGTSLVIDMRENGTDDTEKEKERHPGSDLVADYDGIVSAMIVRDGTPRVRIGDEVKQGQVLVEGKVPIYGEDGSERESLKVDTDADVVIRHMLHWEESLDRQYQEKEYSGREKKDIIFGFGGKRLMIRMGTPFFQETSLVTEHIPKLCKTFEIPFSVGVVRHRECLTVVKKYTEQEQQQRISDNLLHFISTLEEKGVQIIEKNVKIDDMGDSIKIIGDFEVLERAGSFRETEDEFDDGSQ